MFLKRFAKPARAMLAFALAAGMAAPALADEEKPLSMAAHQDFAYKGPNIWAGWRTSKGPVFQSTTSYTAANPLLGEFGVGFYFNMYGSQLDNRNNTRSTAGQNITGNKALGLGNIDEAQFFGSWSRSFADLTLNLAYWHYSYGWNLYFTDLEWFGNRNSGEVTFAPSYTLGSFTLFTEQNVTVVAADLGGSTLNNCDPSVDPTCQVLFNPNSKQSDLGAYHAVYGVTWAHDAEPMGINLGIKTEWANWKFIEPWIYQGDNQVKIQEQPWYNRFYHVTMTAGTSYSPTPWASISATFGVQYMLNKWVDLDLNYHGSFPFAGINTSFTYDL